MPTALITGASVGIGAEFARQLAAGGHDLVLVARSSSALESLGADLAARHGVAYEVLTADLADRAQVERVAERLRSTENPVDLLVNNAGFGLEKAFLDEDLVDEERMLDVMVRAVLVLSHSAGRAMRERGRGTVVNVASVAAFLNSGTYSAAKSYVTVFSESLDQQLRGTGVRVMALCPGFTRTEFHQRAEVDVSGMPSWMWLDARTLVREGLRDVERGVTVSVPSARYKIITAVLRHAPRRLTSARAGRTHRPGAFES